MIWIFASARLQGLDAMLETDGLWPRCPARAQTCDILWYLRVVHEIQDPARVVHRSALPGMIPGMGSSSISRQCRASQVWPWLIACRAPRVWSGDVSDTSKRLGNIRKQMKESPAWGRSCAVSDGRPWKIPFFYLFLIILIGMHHRSMVWKFLSFWKPVGPVGSVLKPGSSWIQRRLSRLLMSLSWRLRPQWESQAFKFSRFRTDQCLKNPKTNLSHIPNLDPIAPGLFFSLNRFTMVYLFGVLAERVACLGRTIFSPSVIQFLRILRHSSVLSHRAIRCSGKPSPSRSPAVRKPWSRWPYIHDMRVRQFVLSMISMVGNRSKMI